MCCEKSSTTATLQHCPASEVPATARKNRRAKFSCRRMDRDHIVSISGAYYADRHLPVARPIGRIQGAIPGIKTHFAGNARSQRDLQRVGIHFL